LLRAAICTCKDFANRYDHKQFHVARGLTRVGPSPRGDTMLAFTFVRRTPNVAKKKVAKKPAKKAVKKVAKKKVAAKKPAKKKVAKKKVAKK
jgi:hypothetical protein